MAAGDRFVGGVVAQGRTGDVHAVTGPLVGVLTAEGAGVGGSSSSYDPFADSHEIEYDPVVPGPSAKALG